MAVRRFVLGTDLNNMQLLAADVNNDNNINSTDALLILKRYTGTVASFVKPDWIIAPAGINITIANGNVVKNSSCIATGDIDRSWTPQ
jgi:hypothetical protein